MVKGSQGRLPEGGGISAKPQRVSISYNQVERRGVPGKGPAGRRPEGETSTVLGGVAGVRADEAGGQGQAEGLGPCEGAGSHMSP